MHIQGLAINPQIFLIFLTIHVVNYISLIFILLIISVRGMLKQETLEFQPHFSDQDYVNMDNLVNFCIRFSSKRIYNIS